MFSPGVEYHKKSETELILLARTDRTAFGELYERHIDKVYTYVRYRTANQAQTEDIVSATFLKAMEHLDQFRPKGGGFTAWLLRIARNHIFDETRKNKRLTFTSHEIDAGADTASPEQQILQREQAVLVQRIVAKLPEAQREAVLFKYTLGLKNKEIAQVIGKSETAVSSLLHRAMQSLRTEVTSK